MTSKINAIIWTTETMFPTESRAIIIDKVAQI